MSEKDIFGGIISDVQNAQLAVALPENTQTFLPAVDWDALGVDKKLVPQPLPLENWYSASPCPCADIVVITWTVAEWAAMNQVLTNWRTSLTPEQVKGKKWGADWVKYQRNYHQIFQYMVGVSQMGQGGAPSLSEEAWGSLRLVQIGDLRVLLVKSGMHLAQDGSELPLIKLMQQLCQESKPKLVLSIGTAGAVRNEDALGSVLVSNRAVFHCTRRFIGAEFNGQHYQSDWQPDTRYFEKIKGALFQTQGPIVLPLSPQYPADACIYPHKPDACIKVVDEPIITADTFLFGSTSNPLDQYGCIVEMDDAVVAMVCNEYDIPYGFLRNVSDPIMNGDLPDSIQSAWAGYIYQQNGLFTSFNGALATWACLAAEAQRGRTDS